MRSLFTSPLKEQYKKLVDMLNIMVARLDRPTDMLPLLEQLGTRHRQYGVKSEHYIAIGQVLLWKLKSGLGDRWSSDMEIAWKSLYEQVATVMIGVN
jgi:nitric oxide dioxygenase